MCFVLRVTHGLGLLKAPCCSGVTHFTPKGFYPDSDDSSTTISVIVTHVNWLA